MSAGGLAGRTDPLFLEVVDPRHAAALRRLVAFGGHAPALWLFYREALPVPLRRPNVIAVAATLVMMAVVPFAARAAGAATEAGWLVLGTWLVGHFAWGTFLAVKLPDTV